MPPRNSLDIKRDARAVHDPLVGKTIGGRYTILRLIGRGGVGLVYLASQADAAELVVVKVLAPDWAHNHEALARFEREVERLNTLHHPNIVRMLDYGHEDGRGYMVMEYVDGITIGQYVRQRREIDMEDFVPIAAQILKGVGYAHSRGLMHRDIKPSNIMLTIRNGRGNFVKILDFGLAKLIEGEKLITAQHVVGTAGFLSPEQIKGEELNLRVDVYGLGVLFYYMLSGEMPFLGENNASLLYKHVHEAPRHLSEVLPPTHRVPDGITSMIMRCLNKAPDDRPDDAEAMTEILIDACPASMFHLPVATASSVARPDASSALQGVSPAASASFPAAESTQDFYIEPPSNVTSDSGLRRSSSAAYPRVQLVEPGARPVPAARSVSWWMVVGASAAVLGGGVLAYVFTQATRDVGATAVVAGDPESLENALLEADRLIETRKLDDAGALLKRIAAATEGDPLRQSRVAALRTRAAIKRSLIRAEQLEAEGELERARAVYEEILQRDEAEVTARERLSALNRELEGSVEVVVETFAIDIVSTPAGELFIDDINVGTTPYHGRLPPGEHRLRVVAAGHDEWRSKVTVTSDQNQPIQIKLKRGGKGSHTKANAKANAKGGTRASGKSREDDEMFLPTSKKSDDGGIFLPVGK